MKAVRITSAEIERAKAAAAEAGLCLASLEKRPDGTLKIEFAAPGLPDDLREGSPLWN